MWEIVSNFVAFLENLNFKTPHIFTNKYCKTSYIPTIKNALSSDYQDLMGHLILTISP